MQAYFIDRRLTLTNVVWKYTLHLAPLSMHFVLLFFCFVSAAWGKFSVFRCRCRFSFTWRRRPSLWAGNSFGETRAINCSMRGAHTRTCGDH